ncbi:MAG TPA: hypothetical protein VNA17_06475 [Pyrinomonadaceae bacterium]|nr:hypothetical protein [Pyrinomonadaceae bacterium]
MGRGFDDPTHKAVARWLDSCSHRHNMMDHDWRKSAIGVGWLLLLYAGIFGSSIVNTAPAGGFEASLLPDPKAAGQRSAYSHQLAMS